MQQFFYVCLFVFNHSSIYLYLRGLKITPDQSTRTSTLHTWYLLCECEGKRSRSLNAERMLEIWSHPLSSYFLNTVHRFLEHRKARQFMHDTQSAKARRKATEAPQLVSLVMDNRAGCTQVSQLACLNAPPPWHQARGVC